MKRPNILYLHSHDTGRWIQPYGYPIPTPNLQQMAEQGAVFRQAFCAAPTCSASRAALLTGQYAHVCGMIGLAHRGFSLHDPGRHLAHVLRQAGYATALSGIQHENHRGLPDGWRALGYEQRLGDHQEPETHAAAFLANPPKQPFFLSVGFPQTHREFPAPGPEDRPDYGPAPPGLPDTPETRRDMASFRASARILDRKMGEVIAALDRNGLRENTLVICTTDHGPAFPGMKCNLTDGGLGVMLILGGPFPGLRPGSVHDAMVSHVDIFPTLCETIGLAPPTDLPAPPDSVGGQAGLQGVSLLPLLRGEKAEVREEIFGEVTYHAAYEPQRGVRTKRWKYIRRFDGRTRPVLPNCDDSPCKTLWIEHGWRERPPEPEALYDLVFDPAETRNRAGDPACATARADMRSRLDRWMRETDDPLLRGPGPVPAPADAVVNDPDGMSASGKTRSAREGGPR